jgi:hypothetical protein
MPACVLAAVLQQQQSVVEELVDWRVRHHADDPTHCVVAFTSLVRPPSVRCGLLRIIKPLRPRLRQPGGGSRRRDRQRRRKRGILPPILPRQGREPGDEHEHEHHQTTPQHAEDRAQESIGEAQARLANDTSQGPRNERAQEQRHQENEPEGEYVTNSLVRAEVGEPCGNGSRKDHRRHDAEDPREQCNELAREPRMNANSVESAITAMTHQSSAGHFAEATMPL